MKGVDARELPNALLTLLGNSDLIIIDAAAGLGREALAAIEAADELILVTNPDLPSVTDALKTINEENLGTRDFFLPLEETKGKLYDVIIMNPPFVRHHLLSTQTQQRIRKIVDDQYEIPLMSDLWVYFVIHSFKYLRNDGNIGVILPWSFLQANFSKKLRKLLLDHFQTITNFQFKDDRE